VLGARGGGRGEQEQGNRGGLVVAGDEGCVCVEGGGGTMRSM
jgi:hypothetical protein